jgi:hypothetical protein
VTDPIFPAIAICCVLIFLATLPKKTMLKTAVVIGTGVLAILTVAQTANVWSN